MAKMGSYWRLHWQPGREREVASGHQPPNQPSRPAGALSARKSRRHFGLRRRRMMRSPGSGGGWIRRGTRPNPSVAGLAPNHLRVLKDSHFWPPPFSGAILPGFSLPVRKRRSSPPASNGPALLNNQALASLRAVVTTPSRNRRGPPRRTKAAEPVRRRLHTTRLSSYNKNEFADPLQPALLPASGRQLGLATEEGGGVRSVGFAPASNPGCMGFAPLPLVGVDQTGPVGGGIMTE
jgi:hypothetical protein